MKDKFPLIGYVTQEILDVATRGSIHNCIGFLTLEQALGKETVCCWGRDMGYIETNDSVYSIDGEGNPIDMMEINSPRQVIFTLDEPENYWDL